MASYYKILTQASTNTYTALTFIEECNSGGTLLEGAGFNGMVVGVSGVGYTPATGGNSESFITCSLLGGGEIKLTYANVYSYDIYGVNSGLADIHAIWDSIQSGNSTAL